ncbi:MAG: hypothetical protein QNJ18_22910 [Xenococcaceae cyanobacterium MO_167.B52]|nr:hypothetical protein [Xenococcaceae cyanobacterium MO_167.B52]
MPDLFSDRLVQAQHPSMLAYYVGWHLRKILAPLLFEDEETSDISPDVIQAHRSESAKKKDRTKRNKENLPIHSFRTLLEDLGTICLNKIKCNLASGSYVFSKITQPSLLQKSCLDLLGVSLNCTQ